MCPCLLILLISLLVLLLFIVKIFRLTNFGVFLRIRDGIRSGKPLIAALFRVDTDSQRHGGELVAEVLKAHGVSELFTLCGGHISPILVACEQLGIRILDTRHEASAVFAADAAARLRQDIGVAAVTAGPGITNTVTALKNAQMAESPVLLLGGASPSLLKGRGALQDIDQQTLLRSLCKFTGRMTSVRQIVPTIRNAIAIAKSGTPGPVFVELPIDVLYPYKMVEREAGLSKEPKGLTKKLLDTFVRAHIARTFSDAWLPQPLLPLPVQIPLPSQAQIERLAELVRSADRPLLLIGSQAMSPPVKASELARIVEALRIPVYLGGMSRGLLGADSAIQMRQERKTALREADLVILAGAVCDFRLGYGRVLSPKCRVVTINRNKQQMLKNHGVFWRSVLAIQADVASTLVQLQQLLTTDRPRGDAIGASSAEDVWLSTLRMREAETEARNAAKAAQHSTADGRLNPLRLLNCLNSVLPQNAILVADGGDFVGSAAYIVQPRAPLQWLDPGAFGTLGVGAGFALGAKAVRPDCPVLILYGDGACGFSLMDIDSLVRHRLPVVALIGNDASWAQIARDQLPWFNSAVGCELSYSNYDEVGIALGARGVRLAEPIGDSELCNRLAHALAQCVAAEAAGGGGGGQSTVINAVIGRTNFREGSISV